MSVSYNMLYAVGESKLTEHLANCQADSYTERQTISFAQKLSVKGPANGINQYPRDKGSTLESGAPGEYLGQLCHGTSRGDPTQTRAVACHDPWLGKMV